MQKPPHPLAYQGSKRKLAPMIYAYSESQSHNRLIEPFAGSAAFTLYCATNNLMEEFLIGESWSALSDFWKDVANNPRVIIEEYSDIWSTQGKSVDKNQEIYNHVRTSFNQSHSSGKLLFLINRCVKNSVRFNERGEFNQSCDKRRLGLTPKKVERHIRQAHEVLRGRVCIFDGDYQELIETANRNDLVYLDPPWVGVTNTKNKRYHQQLDIERFMNNIDLLNTKGINFMISFDGSRGGTSYFEGFPSYLQLKRVEIKAGLSAQSLLNGFKEETIESLYLSRRLEL